MSHPNDSGSNAQKRVSEARANLILVGGGLSLLAIVVLLMRWLGFWDAALTLFLATFLFGGIFEIVDSRKRQDKRGVAVGAGAILGVIAVIGFLVLGTLLGWFNSEENWKCQPGPPPLFLICDSNEGDFAGL